MVANFKETQLARLGVGEAVDMELDQLPGVVLHGRVDSLAPGSGSTFALLPPENATGNFTKIVQRVPVRVRLDPNDALALAAARPVRPRPASTRGRRRTVRCKPWPPRPTGRSPRNERHGRGQGAGRGARRAGSASFRDWIAVLGGALGAFMAVLDIQITNSSLADIQGTLGASLDEGSWISTGYLIAEIIVIPLTGWLGSVFGLRRYLIFNASLFLVFSLLCGFATNLSEMILFRVGQGFSGGVLIPRPSSSCWSVCRCRSEPSAARCSACP